MNFELKLHVVAISAPGRVSSKNCTPQKKNWNHLFMSFNLYRIPTSFHFRVLFRASVILKMDISISVILELSQKVEVPKVSRLLTKKISSSKLGIRIWSILTNLGSRYAERCWKIIEFLGYVNNKALSWRSSLYWS